jgi:(p)ppGpp synthase/HD superfamily hydrolase
MAQEPYVNHLIEVAHLLAEATDGADETLITAGLLHDTMEDVQVTEEELAREFGAEVAALVCEVTDDKTLPKAERKRLQVEHAPHKSARARMIKLADKTCNLRSLLHSPPADWSRQRIEEYYAWASQVIAGCRGVNAYLEAQFDRTHREGLDRLNRREEEQHRC